MLDDPLPSTSASTQQDQQLNFCSQTVSPSRLRILEEPSHLRLLRVGVNIYLTPWRTTSGKDARSTLTYRHLHAEQNQAQLHGILTAKGDGGLGNYF